MASKRYARFMMVFGCQTLDPLARHINFQFYHTPLVIHVLFYLFAVLRQLVRMLVFFIRNILT